MPQGGWRKIPEGRGGACSDKPGRTRGPDDLTCESGLQMASWTLPWNSISALVRYCRYFRFSSTCALSEPASSALHSLLYSPGLENYSVCLGCPSLKMDGVILAFPTVLEGSVGGKDPERTGRRELQPSLARCPSFLLPDNQETAFAVCQGDLASNLSNTLH